MATTRIQIDQKQLLVEISKAEAPLKTIAMEIMKEYAFLPAVAAMKAEFEQHPVTQELKAGVDSPNLSKTISGPFNDPPNRKVDRHKREDYSPPNLTSFIGFADPDKEIAKVEKFLDPKNRVTGPRLEYGGMDRRAGIFHFTINAPNFEAIQKVTPIPWLEGGISWTKRIEQGGIPGVGHFLNAKGKKGSVSGGGIQVEPKLRGGTLKTTSYLSNIFNNFLRRASAAVRR